MKKFLHDNLFVITAIGIWRLTLVAIEYFSSIIPIRLGFLGPTPWANFDGIHYLTIARSGYFQYGEAFFPFYPLIISQISRVVHVDPATAGQAISFLCFSLGLIFLFHILKKESVSVARWTVVFLLVFPTSFFFTAVYTEGLFFLLSVSAYVFAKEKHWWLSGVCGLLASATRLFGAFLFILVFLEYIKTHKKINVRDVLGICLIPLGLIAYMYFLYQRSGDPLLFFHSQPAFGANRSGSSLILLPQVVWRYVKILFTAFLQPTAVSWAVSVGELVGTAGSFYLLFIGWKKKMELSLWCYSLVVLTTPTLTGTFSSMPRYVLSAFPLFWVLGSIENTKTRCVIAVIFGILQIIFCMLFLRGWFVG